MDSAGFVVNPKDAWEQYTHIYDYTPIMSAQKVGLIQNKMWSTPSCIFGQQILHPGVYDHTRKHIRETEHLVCIHRYLHGETYGTTDGQPFSTRPGMIVFRDMSQLYFGIQTEGLAQGIYFPSAVIGYDPSRASNLLTYTQHSTLGRLLHAEFDFFFGELASGASSLDAMRFNRLIACFTLACQGKIANEDVRTVAREALADLIRTYIEENLASPDLTTTTILKSFGVSRASLYRIFAPDGGVRNYISRRRLFRAAVDLSKTATVRGRITRTAERWGFSSNANFHRSIKNVFGVKPGSMFQHPLDRQKALPVDVKGSAHSGEFIDWADDRRSRLAAA